MSDLFEAIESLAKSIISDALLGAAWEDIKASPVETFHSLVLYMCPQRVGRPKIELVVVASGGVFRHKERVPIEYIPSRCKSATMKD